METQHLPEKARELLSKTVSGGTVNAPEALVQTVLQCVTEGKEGWSVDLPRLQRLLNNRAGIEQHERCGLIWDGRDEAEALTQRETYASLRPVPERSKNFETTRNLYIEGDNLEALKLLLPFYGGKVKMIYIDPPYNTGNDFLYKDDFRNVSYGHTTVRDADGLHENKAISGRYHSDWLSMMCPRLNLAKQFLLPRLSSSDKNRCRGIDVLGVRLRTWLEQTELEALTKFFVELLLLNPVMVIFYDSYSGRMAVGVRNRAGDPLSVMELIEEPIWMGKALQDALPCDVRTAFLRLCEPFGKDSLNAKIRELSLRLNKATGTKRKALEKQLSELLAQQSAKPTTNEDT